MRRQTTSVPKAPAPDHDQSWAAPGRSFRFVMPDPRAEGGVRAIEIADGQVTIERSIAGVRMRLAIPATLYEGVALEVGSDEETGYRVAVRLAHEDPELDVLLFEAFDDQDVTAEWQLWANRLGLPLLVSELDGSFSEPFPRLGALLIAAPRPRRKPAHFAARRPRFLARRRVGRVVANPVIHKEREIIARS
jgi:hypothetical protein